MDKILEQKLEKWFDEHFDAMVEDIKTLVRIPSVSTYDEPGTPFGEGCRNVLHAALSMARGYGFAVHNEEDRYGSATLRSRGEDNEIAFWGHLDVVPVSEGWTFTEPFAPIIKDDWLIGRGVEDNKGPAVAVMYMLRAFEELNIPTRHGFKLFFGCDEEHGMADVMHYAANHPAHKLTVIADCGFPVCYGEKGILEANIVSAKPMENIAAFDGGMASNIVPDSARMVLRGSAAVNDEWVKSTAQEGNTVLEAGGRAAHSAAPQNGINAIHNLTGAALQSGLLSTEETKVVSFFNAVNDDTAGTAVGIAAKDEVSGETTCAGTMARRREDGRIMLHLNIRYVISADSAKMLENMRRLCAENGCVLEVVRDSAPSYFPRENPVVDAMTAVYNAMTGENAQPYVMGGGTYARKLDNALAFGIGGLPCDKSMFAPGHGGGHQCDEGLYLPNLKKGILILAMSVLEADKVL